MTESWDIDLPAASEGDAADLVINAQGFAVTVQPRPSDRQPNAEATVITFDNGISVLVRLSRSSPDKTVIVETYGPQHKVGTNLAADMPSSFTDTVLGQARSHLEFRQP